MMMIVNEWFDVNKLSLNEDKTTFLMFSSKRKNKNESEYTWSLN